jgi:hypothetical protein
LKLIDKHATQYNDRDIVNQLYSDVTSTKGEKVPYAVKFAAVKAFLKYKIVKGSIQYNDLQNKIQKDTN